MAELDPALVEKAARIHHESGPNGAGSWDRAAEHIRDRARERMAAALDAVAPAIREAALIEAAEETHRESRYIAEMTMRGQRPDPLDRVTVLEHTLRYLAAQQREERD